MANLGFSERAKSVKAFIVLVLRICCLAGFWLEPCKAKNNPKGMIMGCEQTKNKKVSDEKLERFDYFEGAIEKLVPKFIKLLSSLKIQGEEIQDPGNYYFIDYYRKTIGFFFPLKKNLVYPVVMHFSNRSYYTPKSKFCDVEKEQGHFYAMCNAFFRRIRKRGFKIKERMIRDRTFFAFCPTYTRRVRGGQRRYNNISVRVHVVKKFKDLGEALKRAWKVVLNYLSKRLVKLRYRFREKRVKSPWGDPKDLHDNLDNIIKWIELVWL